MDPYATHAVTIISRALALPYRVRLCTAESCTGGLIAAHLTAAPGASQVVDGGIVAYHNRFKTDFLSVPDQLLVDYGAVSWQVAETMAEQIALMSASSLTRSKQHDMSCEGNQKRICRVIGLSTTGIAGPDGGTVDKPVGTVYIGVAQIEHRGINHRGDPMLSTLNIMHQRLQLNGSRDAIRARTADMALSWLISLLD